MSKKYYVFSTLAAAVTYCGWKDGGSDVPNIERKVTIAGKAGLADKHLVTSRGAVTPVDEDELALLRSDGTFQLHEKNGYIRVEDSPANIEDVVPDMTGRDPSAPLVPQDFDTKATLENTRDNNRVSAPETTPGGKGGDKAKK